MDTSDCSRLHRHAHELIRGEKTATNDCTTTTARIVRNPRILDGEPTVEGTRVPVRSIVLAQRLYADADRVARAFPTLNRAAVEAALFFYAGHRAEIERAIAENSDAARA